MLLPMPPSDRLDCATACVQGCVRPEACASAEARARVEALLRHPRFDPLAPNSVRAVLGGLVSNTPLFHHSDGSGYRFLAAQIAALDQRNPITASRLVKVFSRWRSYGPERQERQREALVQLAAAPLSTNSREVVTQCLGAGHEIGHPCLVRPIDPATRIRGEQIEHGVDADVVQDVLALVADSLDPFDADPCEIAERQPAHGLFDPEQIRVQRLTATVHLDVDVGSIVAQPLDERVCHLGDGIGTLDDRDDLARIGDETIEQRRRRTFERSGHRQDPLSSTEADPVADGDRTQNLGAGADDDVVADRRVTFAMAGVRHAEGDLVVNIAVVPDFRGFADHDPHPMVDDEASSDLRGGMNLDSRQPSREMRRESSQEEKSVDPQRIR